MVMLVVNIAIINMREKGLVDDEKRRISDQTAHKDD